MNKPAPLIRRFFAFWLDLICFNTFFLSSGLYVFVYESLFKPSKLSERAELPFYMIYMLLAHFLYFGLITYRRGSSPGKYLLNLKVISLNQKKLNISQVFLRECVARGVVYTLSLIMIRDLLLVLKQEYPNYDFYFVGPELLILSGLVIFTNTKRRALHDFIGRTMVVKGD